MTALPPPGSFEPNPMAWAEANATELVEYLSAALTAARDYRDRVRGINAIGAVREGDLEYLASKRLVIAEATAKAGTQWELLP